MARKDYVYFDLPKKMAMSLDVILNIEGRKHGIESRSELVRTILSDFIAYYEHDKFFKAKVASKQFLGKEEEEDPKSTKKLRKAQLLF